MIIHPPQKRREFEILIKQIGYKDQSPVLIHKTKKYQYPILEHLSGNQYEIFYFTKPYFTKKTYLYEFFLTNYVNLNKKEMKKELKLLSKNILYKEKTRICEIGWGINNSQRLYFSTKDHLKKIYFSILKKGKKDLIEGDFFLKPQEGDLLVSKPDGGKLLGHNNKKRYLTGRHQRSRINYKLGFGELKEHNSQYARYDKNLIPRPI